MKSIHHVKSTFALYLILCFSIPVDAQGLRWELQSGIDIHTGFLEEEYEGSFGFGLAYERALSEKFTLGIGSSFVHFTNYDISVNMIPVNALVKLELFKNVIHTDYKSKQ